MIQQLGASDAGGISFSHRPNQIAFAYLPVARLSLALLAPSQELSSDPIRAEHSQAGDR
jgi:hypothetical protein